MASWNAGRTTRRWLQSLADFCSLDDAWRLAQRGWQHQRGGFEPLPAQRAEINHLRQLPEFQQHKRLAALAAVLLCTASGAVAAKAMLEPISWVEAIYFAVTTITTVGYGDYNPVQVTRHRRLVYAMFMVFHMCYIIVGVGTMGAAVALLLESQIYNPARSRSLGTTVATASCACGLLVAIGAIGMCWIEEWDALRGTYWAVVTLSTVGYGTVVPQTNGGRVFAVLYMLAGISCEATLFSSIAMMPVREYRRVLEKQLLRQMEQLREKDIDEIAAGEELKELGLSESESYVTRDEFCLVMLVRMEKISAADLRECQAAFAKLDNRNRGRLPIGACKRFASSSTTSSDLD